MKLTETISLILNSKDGSVWTIGPDASVYEAVELMASRQIGALLVMVEGELRGILSERDYARKVILQGRSSRQTHVSEIMSSPVITVTPTHTLEDCMKIVTEKRIRHLPVVDDGRVVGVVSIGDLVRAIITVQKETIQQLHNYIAGAYPG